MAEISGVADTLTCAYPNAGLPNAFGEYDQDEEEMAAQLEAFAAEGLVNIIGGCCGSTPEHIAALAEMASRHAPRLVPKIKPLMRPVGPGALHADQGHSLSSMWASGPTSRARRSSGS